MVAITNENSTLADLVRSACGVVVPPGQPESLAATRWSLAATRWPFAGDLDARRRPGKTGQA